MTTVRLCMIAALGACSLAMAVDETVQPPEARPGVPPGMRLIEGDIAVPLDFDDTRAAYVVDLWPGGIIPVTFNSNVSPANTALFIQAMNEWESLANLQFTGWTGEDDYIEVVADTMNFSSIGRQGGRQEIHIVSWSVHGTLVHELGHALGYWHEQARSDRNNYVHINFSHVCQTCCDGSCNSQFTIRTNGAEHGPYDFDSVMHYDSCDFTNCATCTDNNVACRTIDVLPPYTAYQTVIGQRVGASYWDGRIMSFLYPQPTWKFAATSAMSEFPSGLFLYPWVGFADGFVNSADGDTLFLYPGTYEAVGRWTEPKRIEPTSDPVILGA